jgi:H+/Cl- antiporter ClcA
MSRKIVFALGLIVGIAVTAIVAIFWREGGSNLSANLRDITIILVALESLAIGGLLIVLVWQMYQLVKLLRTEIIPLLNTTTETVDQLKNTSTFVTQSVAGPIITMRGVAAGIREAIQTLRGQNQPPDPWS